MGQNEVETGQTEEANEDPEAPEGRTVRAVIGLATQGNEELPFEGEDEEDREHFEEEGEEVASELDS